MPDEKIIDEQPTEDQSTEEQNLPEPVEQAVEAVQETKPVEATPPGNLDETESNEIKERALALVTEATTSNDRGVIRKFSNIGASAQQETRAKVGLLKTRLGTLMKDLDGDGATIPNDLLKLREVMDEINPHKLTEPKKTFLGLVKKIPKIGDVLVKIARKYETVQSQINEIMNALRSGKDELLRDSLELEGLYNQVQAAQLDLKKNAYLGELIMQKMEEMLKETEDLAEKSKFENILHKTAMRTQDLRTMEQMNQQFFISLDMTINNNDQLSDSIDRTIIVCDGVLTVGLSLQVALANQKRITKSVQATQEYTANMLVANAAAVKSQTIEIAELQNNPVLALDKVKQAHMSLLEAIDATDDIKRAGIASAKDGIKQLTEMSEVLNVKVEGLHAARKAEAKMVHEETEPEAIDNEGEQELIEE